MDVLKNDYGFWSLSSLKEVWVAVLNITGPLSNWSFANHKIPGDFNFVGRDHFSVYHAQSVGLFV